MVYEKEICVNCWHSALGNIRGETVLYCYNFYRCVPQNYCCDKFKNYLTS